MSERLVPGLYEQPITEGLAKRLARLADGLRAETGTLDKDAVPHALARLLHGRLVHALRSFKGKDALAHQVELANAVVDVLRREANESGVLAEDRLPLALEQLLAVVVQSEGLGRSEAPPRPTVPLGTSDLLVNGRHDVSIGPEVKRELASADRVDLLCSFLKWSGFRLVEPEVKAFLARRPGALRVLTTAYMGATERRAFDELANLGAQVRVSYDTGRTRLHAKAWLFHRDSGYSTACVGSSNLSHAAMLDGLEWNVRLSQIDNKPILAKFETTFAQYWHDPEFSPYEPARDASKFDEAVRRQVHQRTRLFMAFDIRARPHQQEILDDLEVERQHGHTRNLVVAATGTGKTVVAALDYARLRKSLRERGRKGSLLFVAHRNEILDQSQTTFQVVLKDGAFGERLGGGEAPRAGEHVFASVQSLHADRLAELSPEAYDVVIVDKFHHAAAPTYARLLEHLEPRYLLGLTATPERTDGGDILTWFDGRVASELRLWKALDQGLLSPFQYFGVQGPDVSGVTWKGGKYDTKQLSNVYTVDHFMVKRVLQEVHHKVSDPMTMKALGFCVDIAHADFMAEHFNRAGLSAEAVSSNTNDKDRAAALARLRDGSLRVLFSVNLFNEGVDVPDVDTVLFLRPTESATLFLQQLGRGLRRSDDKECLTVLDFIGHANRRFRFDRRFRAIVGGTRRQIERHVKEGFPFLPSGCSIHLDRHAQEAVLENIRSTLGAGYKSLVEDVRALARQQGTATLRAFVEEAGVELEDIYAGGRCFCLLYTSPSPRDLSTSRMPSSA